MPQLLPESAPAVNVTEHLAWAASVARGVARDFKFKRESQEEDDIKSVAALTVVRMAANFDPSRVPAGGDPGGQFRGWVHRSVQGMCKREARRLRNGGTYHTRREVTGVALVAEEMSAHATADGTPIEVPDLHTPVSAYRFPDLDGGEGGCTAGEPWHDARNGLWGWWYTTPDQPRSGGVCGQLFWVMWDNNPADRYTVGGRRVLWDDRETAVEELKAARRGAGLALSRAG